MRLVDAFVRRPAAAVGWLLSSLGLTSTRTKGGAPRAKNNKGKCNPDDEVTRAEVGASTRSRPENIGSPELNDRVNSSGEESDAIVDRTAGVQRRGVSLGANRIKYPTRRPVGRPPRGVRRAHPSRRGVSGYALRHVRVQVVAKGDVQPKLLAQGTRAPGRPARTLRATPRTNPTTPLRRKVEKHETD